MTQLSVVAFVAVAAVLSVASAVETASEVAPYLVGGTSTSQRLSIFAGGDLRSGSSKWSKDLLLQDCLQDSRSVEAMLQSQATRRAVLGNCRDEAERIVATTPASSAAWLVIATMSAGLGEVDRMRVALASSRRTAPNLQWLAGRRMQLAEANFDNLDQQGRADYEADIGVMGLSDQGASILAQQYVRMPELRDTYTRVLETLPAQRQAAFLDRVKAQSRASQ